ncbi:MAG: hypothetical protein ACI4HN_09895 [Ruminococcus sp.]
MTDFLQNLYVILWGVLALLTFAIGIKQKAAYAFVISAFFVFMTVWYALDTYSGMDMFAGVFGIVFKVVLVAVLALFVGFYFLSKRRGSGK